MNKIKELLEKEEIPNLEAAENPDAAKEADALVLTVRWLLKGQLFYPSRKVQPGKY